MRHASRCLRAAYAAGGQVSLLLLLPDSMRSLGFNEHDDRAQPGVDA